MSWATASLGEIFEVARGGSPRPIEDYLTDDPEGLNWVLIGDATASGKTITKTKKRIRREGLSKTRAVKPGDFILSNSMSFGRPYIMGIDGCIHDGWLLLRPKSDKIFPAYFYHLLGSSEVYQRFASRAAGATVKNLNSEIVREVEISFPPFDEQRRIAAILDQAEDVRRKRLAALEQLGSYSWSMFREAFGDPISNSKKWNERSVAELLEIPLRNGVSPSSAGTITEYVLTLSAITGTSFDATCVKEGTFETIAPQEKRVSSSDFLICRGNGNLNLVGKGFFATASGNTIFPDTMIAARFSRELFEPPFIETLWNSQYVRSQLQPRARTTNGTFKINQGALEGIKFPVPPIDLQHAFAARIAEIGKLKAHHLAHLAKLDALFASLQHRAFKGKL